MEADESVEMDEMMMLHGGEGKRAPEEAQGRNGEECVKMISWEEFQDSLAHLCGTATVLANAQLQKRALAKKLEAFVEARSKSLRRVDNLEALEKELQLRKLRLKNLKLLLQKNTEKAVQEGELTLPSSHALLFSSRELVSAQGRLQDADRLLAGDGGYLRLMQLSKLLSNRRRLMIAQVAGFYPMSICHCVGIAATKHACSSLSPVIHPPGKSTLEVASTSRRPFSILGLHILAPSNKASSLFGGKQSHEGTATALGYVGHVVLLVASYLGVPLRYPIRFAASHSYVQDHSPPINHQQGITAQSIAVSSSEGPSVPILEFPLFSEGQDSTRAAYAIFLLNKDLEQLLNYLGCESAGPRHTLPNLHRLLSTMCSGKNLLL